MTQTAIIGAGPGGLTLAAVLHRHGLPATVFERDAHRDARPQGGALDLHPDTGQAALRAAGAHDGFVRRARHAGQDMRILEPDGTVVLDQRTPDDAPLVDPEVDRQDLRDLLLDAVPDGTVRWNARLTRVSRRPDNTSGVFFADGTSTVCDLLVGADGARSVVRPLVTDAEPAPTGERQVETGIAEPGADHAAVLELVGRGNLWALGTDRFIAAQRLGDSTLRVSCAFREVEPPADHAGLLAAFTGWAPVLRALLDACDLPLTTRRVHAMPVGVTWPTTPGVTLLGDAAHLMPPVGMGANLAMLDGAELGVALAANPGARDEAVATAEAAMLHRAASAAATSAAIAAQLMSPTAARDVAALVG